MKDPMNPESYPQPSFNEQEVSLQIAHYYRIMRQRLGETYGTRIRFSLTSVPSCVVVSAVEYALSFTVALSARLLLSVYHAPRVTAALREAPDGALCLSFTATDGTEVALDAYRTLFTGIAERGGFTTTVEGGDAVTITVRLRRSSAAKTELREAFDVARRDPFADALAYPL